MHVAKFAPPTMSARLVFVVATLGHALATCWVLVALAGGLTGCHGQNPYGVWGPSRIPPPAQAKALPYYPPSTSLSQSDTVRRSPSGVSASRSDAASVDQATISSRDRVEAKATNPAPPSGGRFAASRDMPADSTDLRIEPEDRRPIRIVENPRPAVQTARAGANREDDRSSSKSSAQGMPAVPATSSTSQSPP